MDTPLDFRSLVVAGFVVNLYMCLLLMVYAASQKTYPGYFFWLLGSGFSTLAYVLFGLRGILPDFFTIVVANVVGLLFSMARLEGVRRYAGQTRWSVGGWGAVLASSVVFAFFTYVQPSAPLRNAVFTVFTVMFAGAIIKWLYHNQQGESPVIRRFLSVMLIASIVLMTGRAVMWLGWPETANIISNDLVAISLVIINILFDITWPMSFVLLNSHRVYAETEYLRQQLEQHASFDALTGLFNRRKFLELGTHEWARARRYGHHLSLMLFDLDNFKTVNDTFGHAAGDEVLKQVAHTCQHALRGTDVLGRLGGDEFVVLFPETNTHTAHTIAARIEQQVRAIPFPWADQVPVGLSYGIASLHPGDADLDAMLARADDMLYAMKDQHRQAETP